MDNGSTAPRDLSDSAQAALRAWGDVIRRYRLWQGLSRRELAARAGLSPVFLGEIERGEKDHSAQSLVRISQALRVPVAEMYLRVAASLDGHVSAEQEREQMTLPRLIRETDNTYPKGVPPGRDETAYDLYEASRQLPASQQVALLILARSLLTQSDERQG
ncbi:MAG TPA: helix-turn-helix transcriptional regulator [Chloroflexota bacterium]|nr:helix-turn-helix transcriptional regulator [Chloroflexota bacterium]